MSQAVFARVWLLAVVLADVNGDGKPDLLMSHSNSGAGAGVDVLLGNGDGTFQTAVTYGSLRLANDFAVADLNGDGKPDIAVASTPLDDSILSVFLGNGDGTFQAPVNFDLGVSTVPSGVVVADVNGDGRPDILASHYQPGAVSVLLNTSTPLTTTQDFSGSFNHNAASATPGGQATYLLTVTPSGGFTGNVALSVYNLPPGVTGGFSPSVVTGGSGTSTLTLTTATSGLLSHATTLTLLVGTVDFTGSATPTSQAVSAGNSAVYNIALSTVGTLPFGNNVALSVIGLPPGVTASFSNPTISPDANGTSVLTLSTTTSAPPGSYTLTLTGTGGGVTHNTSIGLQIGAVATAGDFAGSFNHGAASANPGGQATYGLTVIPSGGFNGSVVLSVSNLPPGATANWLPSIVTGAPWTSTLTISTSPTTPPGNYSIAVAGQSGLLSHGTTLTLLVGTVDFTGSVTPTSQAVSAT